MSTFRMHGSKIHITLNHTGPDNFHRNENHSTSFRVGGKTYDFPGVELDDAIEQFEQIILSEIDQQTNLPDVIYCVYSTYQTYCCIDWQAIEQSYLTKS